MIRDLVYPEDARKELNSLLGGLAYDAAVAVAGVALCEMNTSPTSAAFSRRPLSVGPRYALVTGVTGFRPQSEVVPW